jgi:hypothetical protein
VTTVLATAAAGFTLLCLACLVWLHIAPTGYSAVGNAVSEYGVGDDARWYRGQATCAGIAGLLLAGALANEFDPAPRLAIALLCVFGVTRIAIPWFPTDLIRSGETTGTGRIHLLLAAVAFASVSWAACDLGRNEDGEPVLGYVMAATAAATFVAIRTPRLQPILGLVERAFYAAMLTWFFLVSYRLAAG